MSPKFTTADDAVRQIADGATVINDGFTMMGVAEEVLAALEQRFRTTGSPANLTVVHAGGQSNRIAGFEHFAVEGMVKRVVGSHWGLMPKMSAFLGESRAECICLPQGQITQMFRASAARRPGHLSNVGLGTFVDPRLHGGKVNASAQRSAPDYVELLTVAGQEVLFYRSLQVDVAIFRATEVDEDGNCTQGEEAVFLDTLSIAQAAHNSGGLVICQAKRIVPRGSIPPRNVIVPGVLVDIVVPVSDAERFHRQTDSAVLDRALTGCRADRLIASDSPSETSAQASASDPSHQSPRANDDSFKKRMAVGRRAVKYLSPGDVINLGTGIPGDTIGRALEEVGLAEDVVLSVESGVYGGTPAGGTDFGVAAWPSAIIPQAAQFDFYNGGGLDATFMGLGQVDRHGNVNVSALGGLRIGCGGFIDITQTAKSVYFCFIFDGKFPKFVDEVDELTFSAKQALARNQEVRYLSDRAVFALSSDGLVLEEHAADSDVDQLLATIPFRVRISPNLREIPADVFASNLGVQS